MRKDQQQYLYLSPLTRFRLQKLGVAVLMLTLFLLVYLGCNYLSSLKPHVPSFYFAWERYIPFIPWTVIPYCSLYILAPIALLMSDNWPAIKPLILQFLLMLGITCVCFLLFPLRFAFTRPEGDNEFLHVFFHFINSVDKPFNQAPSLHVGVAVLIGMFYWHHLRTWHNKWLMISWQTLICLSVLTTYQHHAIDIVTGVSLAAICIRLFAYPRHPTT